MKKVLSMVVAVITLLAITVSTSVSSFAADLSKDGEYSVNVYLVQKDKDKETPASDGVLKQAEIIVKNGKATMYIHTQPVTITMITSTLKALTVFKNDDASDNGTTAKVVSKDSDGNPNCFSFELPHTREFIRIKVDTGLKVPGVIGARLKVDWSSLKLVKADAPATTKTTTAVSKADETTKPADNSTTAKTDESTTAPTETTASTNAADTNDETAPVTDNAVSNDIATAASEQNSSAADTDTDGASTETAQNSSSPLKIVIPVVLAVVIIAAVVIIVVKKKKA